DQHVSGLARTLLADPSLPGRLRASLGYAWVETEVADQLAGGREATDVADRGEQRSGGDEVHAGQGEQASPLRRGEHLLGQGLLDQGDLTVEELDLAQAGRNRLLLIGREDLRVEPAAPAGAEQI